MSATPRCKLCKRKLRAAESLAKGVGPECATKFATMLVGAGITLEALNIPVSISVDPLVARYLYTAEQALLQGNKAHVERFKTAAREAAGRLQPGGGVIFSTSGQGRAPNCG